MEDYLTIIPDLSMIHGNDDVIKNRFRDSVIPLITIAANNGFQYMA
jgi:hypothetical protein